MQNENNLWSTRISQQDLISSIKINQYLSTTSTHISSITAGYTINEVNATTTAPPRSHHENASKNAMPNFSRKDNPPLPLHEVHFFNPMLIKGGIQGLQRTRTNIALGMIADDATRTAQIMMGTSLTCDDDN